MTDLPIVAFIFKLWASGTEFPVAVLAKEDTKKRSEGRVQKAGVRGQTGLISSAF